jgi:hypothetical protein
LGQSSFHDQSLAYFLRLLDLLLDLLPFDVLITNPLVHVCLRCRAACEHCCFESR